MKLQSLRLFAVVTMIFMQCLHPTIVMADNSASNANDPTLAASSVSSETTCGLSAPAGNVPIGYFHDSSCFGSGPNATRYQAPVSGLSMCGFRVPAGFVATHHASESDCNTGAGLGIINATTIKTPEDGLTICGFTVPLEFASVAYRSENGCSTDGRIGVINATIIRTPSSGLTICGFIAPVGFVPVVYKSVNECQIDGRLGLTNASVIRAPESGLTICGFKVPPGYTISSKTYNSDCNTNGIISNPNALVIQASSTGSGKLDLVFVIDTTGSMYDDIDAVKASATSIVNTISERGIDFRIGLVDFKDHPLYPYGGLGDYPSRVDLAFSNDKTAIVAAINGLVVGGGGDTPEAVFSGVMTGLAFSWRSDAQRSVILMGDAPPHDPEPITGFTRASVIAAANAARVGVSGGTSSLVSTAAVDEIITTGRVGIYPVLIGYDPDAQSSFESLAEGTGGSLFDAADSSAVVKAILEAITEILQSPVANAGGPYEGDLGTPITLDASSSFDSDGTIIHFEWDVESDGTYDITTTNPIAVYTYIDAFSGQVTLRVTDNDGRESVATTTVTVNPSVADGMSRITIVKANQPQDTQDFRFFGPFGSFVLDDPSSNDGDATAKSVTYDVVPGDYSVSEVVSSPWYLSDITCVGGNYAPNLKGRALNVKTKGGDKIICTFTDQLRGRITVVNYDDVNGNGSKDGDEPALSNWGTHLHGSQFANPIYATTNTVGEVSFVRLKPNSYKVCEVLQSTWTQTQPVDLDSDTKQPCYSFDMLPGQDVTLYFGNTQAKVQSASVTMNNGMVIRTLSPDSSIEPDSVDTSIYEDSGEGRIFLPIISR